MATVTYSVLLAIVLGVICAHCSSFPAYVVELSDATFEHDTQASSGQTTGVWAVLFSDSGAKRHERASLVLDELAADEEKEVIYAKVDVARNLKVARRFADVVFPPCILLFRDRQMYLFDESFEREDILDRVRAFVTSGYTNANPLDVPEHRERTLNLESFEAGTKMDMKVVGAGVLMIVGGLLFQAWAVLNKDKFAPEPKDRAGSSPAAGSGAAAGAPEPKEAAAAAAGGKKRQGGGSSGKAAQGKAQSKTKAS